MSYYYRESLFDLVGSLEESQGFLGNLEDTLRTAGLDHLK